MSEEPLAGAYERNMWRNIEHLSSMELQKKKHSYHGHGVISQDALKGLESANSTWLDNIKYTFIFPGSFLKFIFFVIKKVCVLVLFDF